MKDKPTPAEISAALSHFSGSDTFTKWSPLFPRDVLTDGAHYVAEYCQAYWLMDAIASHQHNPTVKDEPFQVWELTPFRGDAGLGIDSDAWMLSCEDGNDNRVAEQQIEYSDFPLPGFKLYAVRNELGGVTIMLPGEY